nr:uncharacterized protein LOC131278167 isoform X2 [Dasypus novemcinctus]
MKKQPWLDSFRLFNCRHGGEEAGRMRQGRESQLKKVLDSAVSSSEQRSFKPRSTKGAEEQQNRSHRGWPPGEADGLGQCQWMAARHDTLHFREKRLLCCLRVGIYTPGGRDPGTDQMHVSSNLCTEQVPIPIEAGVGCSWFGFQFRPGHSFSHNISPGLGKKKILKYRYTREKERRVGEVLVMVT